VEPIKQIYFLHFQLRIFLNEDEYVKTSDIF